MRSFEYYQKNEQGLASKFNLSQDRVNNIAKGVYAGFPAQVIQEIQAIASKQPLETPILSRSVRVPDIYTLRGIDVTAGEVKEIVKSHVQKIGKTLGQKIKVKDIQIIGSRIGGTPKKESDIDVLIQYEGNIPEQSLKDIFAMSNNILEIENAGVDITFTKEPINK